MVGGLFKGRDREPVPGIPADRLQRVQRSFRRRLSDQVEDVFHRACVEDDLQTAEALYQLLEFAQHRRHRAYAVERRVNNESIVAARQALERCRIRNKHLMPSSGLPAEVDGSKVTAEPYLPFYLHLMDNVEPVTDAGSGPANRAGTPYRAIGHYTLPADERIDPRRRPSMGT